VSVYVISIPETLYDKARRIAEQTARPVDEVIRARLEQSLDGMRLDLQDGERAELRALAYLSDDALWTIACEQMPSARQQRMQALMDKNNFDSISDDEHDELTQIVELGQRLMLRKAEAMKLLMDRGYSISLDALKPTIG
jgi:hypothetical protein